MRKDGEGGRKVCEGGQRENIGGNGWGKRVRWGLKVLKGEEEVIGTETFSTGK